MKIHNLTPHPITLVTLEGKDISFPPAMEPARIHSSFCPIDSFEVEGGEEVQLLMEEFGEIQFLPEPQEGVILLVSRMVAEVARDRQDLFFPVDLRRDKIGRITGAFGISWFTS